jgi:hypothetical protein
MVLMVVMILVLENYAFTPAIGRFSFAASAARQRYHAAVVPCGRQRSP